MTKRARLTLQEVLLHCDSDDEDYDDGYLDDPDEPVMDGSDDEFSDLEGNDLDELEGDLDSSPDPSPTTGSLESSGAAASPGSPDSSGSTTWTATTKRVPIQPFTSPTGPIEDISEKPMEVFDLFFTPDLMEEIVKQSNQYAKVVMGPEKYDKWTKITVEEFKAFLGFSILMGINHLPSLVQRSSPQVCSRGRSNLLR